MKKYIIFGLILALPLAAAAQMSKIRGAEIALQNRELKEAMADAKEGLKDESLNAKQKAQGYVVLAEASFIHINNNVKKQDAAAIDAMLAEHPDVYFECAEAFENIKKNDEKGRYYTSKHQNYYLNLGLFMSQMASRRLTEKKYAEVEKYAQKAIEIYKASSFVDPQISLIRGSAFYSQEPPKLRDAASSFKQTIDDYKAEYARLKAKDPASMNAGEKRTFDYLSNTFPEQLKLAYDRLADCYAQLNETDKAIKTLDEAMKRFPDYPGFMTQMLNIRLEHSDPAEAIDDFKKAIDKDPDNAQYRRVYAALLEKLAEEARDKNGVDSPEADKAYQKASEAYKAWLKIDPENKNANFNIAALHFNRAVAYGKAADDVPTSEKDKYNALMAKKEENLKIAYPYMKKAAKLFEYTKADALDVVMSIAVELGEMEVYKEYKGYKEQLGG